MADVTENSRIPFGKPGRFGFKGKKLGSLADKALEWIARELWDSDLHAWALAARTIIDKRAVEGKKIEREKSLDQQADDFLRNRGYGKLARRH